MNQDRFEELCAAYALGVIEQEELQELKQELDHRRPEQLKRLAEIVHTAQALPASAKQHTPPERVKASIMAHIRDQGNGANTHEAAITPLPPSGPSWIRLAAVFLLATCLALAYFTVNLSSERNALEEVVEEQRLELLNLEDRLSLVGSVDGMPQALGFPSKTAFRKWGKQLKRIRNCLAHGDGLLGAVPDPEEALKELHHIREFAQRAADVVREG